MALYSLRGLEERHVMKEAAALRELCRICTACEHSLRDCTASQERLSHEATARGVVLPS